jgi:hypothetical protein
MLNGKMTHECWTGKDVEGSGYSLTDVKLFNFPGGTQENHKKPQSG